MKNFFKNNWLLILVLLSCYWAVRPLLSAGFFPMHDDTQPARIGMMFNALSQGQFPVRIVDGLGYGFGYPIFNFYAPLAYYFGAFFKLFSVSFITATKLSFIFSLITAAVTAYFLGKELWGKWGGALTALFYIFAPYHAVNLYVRGALSELWALAFAPLIYLGLIKMFQAKQISSFAVTIFTFGFVGVMLSHNLSVLINLPFVTLWILIMLLVKKEKAIFLKNLLLTVFFSVGLSAFYWLPALLEMRVTKVFGQIGGGADFADHFVFFDQLWASPWGFGGSAPGRLDGLSFMVGKIHVILAGFVLIVFLIRLLKKKKDLLLLIGLLTTGFFLSLFLTLSCSSFFWQAIGPMAFIQYPWRFLGMAILFVSLLAGGLPLLLGKREVLKMVLIVFFSIGLITFSQKYFQAQTVTHKTDQDYLSEEKIKWDVSKISDEYLPKNFPVPEIKEEVAWQRLVQLTATAEFEKIDHRLTEQKFIIKAADSSEFLINIAAFPGWQIKVNGQKIEPEIDQGKYKLALDKGESLLELQFNNTPVRNIANLISLFWLFGFLAFIFKFNKKNA